MKFDETGRDKKETLVELIRQGGVQTKETKVKVKEQDFIISAGNIFQFNCQTYVGLIEKQRGMILQQGDVQLPVGIHGTNSVVLASTLRTEVVP